MSIQHIKRLKRLQKDIEQIQSDTTEQDTLSRFNNPPKDFSEFMAYMTRDNAEPLFHPTHLQPLVDALLTTQKKGAQFCFSVPPQHGKTELLVHFIAYYLYFNQDKKVIYLSYSSDLSRTQVDGVRVLLRNLGVKLSTDTANELVITGKRGGLYADGLGGSITGRRASLIIVDDPHKNVAEASSLALRDKVWEGFKGNVLNRRQGGEGKTPTSVIVVHTRFHLDDLIGRLSEVSGWKYINLPAISLDNQPLCPKLQTLSHLLNQKETLGEYHFQSQYQGKPIPRGGKIFGQNIHFYTSLPKDGFKIVFGIDFAYTINAGSDYSAIVELWYHQSTNTFYVTNVERMKCDLNMFSYSLFSKQEKRPATAYWYVGGGDVGFAEVMRSKGCKIITWNATGKGDKLTRAYKTAAAWDSGKILVPALDKDNHVPWLTSFIDEVQSFTGADKADHDDCVDALVAAFDACKQGDISYSAFKGSLDKLYNPQNRLKKSSLRERL